MVKHSGLGKGLEALIPGDDHEPGNTKQQFRFYRIN